MNTQNLNKQILNSKLSNLSTYIKEIKPLLEEDTGKLLKQDNYAELRALEREFQLIVDTMIEINTHIISKLELEPPQDYFNTFMTLGRNEILPQDFATGLAGVVGLRNKVVHKYEVIDPAKFVDDLKENSKQFDEYIEHINKFLEKYSHSGLEPESR
jgi:uncharacterized protein YutE (UPF0331/DUF86 family)